MDKQQRNDSVEREQKIERFVTKAYEIRDNVVWGLWAIVIFLLVGKLLGW